MPFRIHQVHEVIFWGPSVVKKKKKNSDLKIHHCIPGHYSWTHEENSRSFLLGLPIPLKKRKSNGGGHLYMEYECLPAHPPPSCHLHSGYSESQRA